MIIRYYDVTTSKTLSFGGNKGQRYLVVWHETETDGLLLRSQDYYSFSNKEELVSRLCNSIVLSTKRMAAVPTLFLPSMKDSELGEIYLRCVSIVMKHIAEHGDCPLYTHRDELPPELVESVTELSLAISSEEEFIATMSQNKIREIIKGIIQDFEANDYEEED